MGMMTRLLAGIFARRRKTRGPVRRAVDDGQLARLRFHVCKDLSACGSKCCRRGVQILGTDAERIRDFVARHPEHFALIRGIAEPFVRHEVTPGVTGYSTEVVTPAGPGREGVSRAERAGLTVSEADRMRGHCVFRWPDGRCSFQTAAVALGHHKWAFKPAPCWLFPLGVASVGERDGARCYRLEYVGGRTEYRDYACGRLDPAGQPAEEALADELAGFKEWFEREPEWFINELQVNDVAKRLGPD